MNACDENRIIAVLALAKEHVPLNEIATGPATEMGLGPEYEAHRCLDYILQELGRFPGHGDVFVETALRSPVIRNRNMALRVLSEWGAGNWPTGMKAAIERAIQVEPDEDVRERMKRVLQGQPLDET
jgi:hypothetical protein